MDFWFANPGGRFVPAKPLDWELKLPYIEDKLRPRELDLTVQYDGEIAVPIQQFAEVLAVEDGKPGKWGRGKVVFRGVVDTYDINDHEDEAKFGVTGVEDLLQIPAPTWFYPYDSITFEDLFADTLVEGEVPGLIAVANSAVPPNPDYDLVNSQRNIIKLPGWGTGSCFGNRDLFSLNYLYIMALRSVSNYNDMMGEDYSYYRDAADLYVRIENGYERSFVQLGGLLIAGAFDTRMRLGTVSEPALKLAGDDQLDWDLMGDMMCDLVISHGKHVRISDDWSYSYWNIRDTSGDGAKNGLLTLKYNDTDVINMSKSIPRDPKVQDLTGMGAGNQRFSVVNAAWRGLRRRDTYEVTDGYLDGYLRTSTLNRYEALQADYQRKIKTRRPISILPGDYVKAYPRRDPAEVMRAARIIRGMDGISTLELGKRTPDDSDNWEELQNIGRGFTGRYKREAHAPVMATAATFKPRDPLHDNCAAGTLSFEIPDEVLKASLFPLVTLALTLELDTDQDLELGRMALLLTMNDEYVTHGAITGIAFGYTLPEIDVTRYVEEGETIDLDIVAALVDEIKDEHTDCTGHPDIVANGTLYFWKRLNLT